MKIFSTKSRFLLFFFAFLVFGCSPIMASFDQASYSQVTSLKVDVLALMDKGTNDYSSEAADITAVQTEMNKAIEYDAHRPKNNITNEMWHLMSDTSGHLWGGFLKQWKKERTLGKAYIADKKVQIDSSFNKIANLEIHKMHSSD